MASFNAVGISTRSTTTTRRLDGRTQSLLWPDTGDGSLTIVRRSSPQHIHHTQPHDPAHRISRSVTNALMLCTNSSRVGIGRPLRCVKSKIGCTADTQQRAGTKERHTAGPHWMSHGFTGHVPTTHSCVTTTPPQQHDQHVNSCMRPTGNVLERLDTHVAASLR